MPCPFHAASTVPPTWRIVISSSQPFVLRGITSTPIGLLAYIFIPLLEVEVSTYTFALLWRSRHTHLLKGLRSLLRRRSRRLLCRRRTNCHGWSLLLLLLTTILLLLSLRRRQHTASPLRERILVSQMSWSRCRHPRGSIWPLRIRETLRVLCRPWTLLLRWVKRVIIMIVHRASWSLLSRVC